jgi:DNA-binding transcriptional ArsR family regulator
MPLINNNEFKQRIISILQHCEGISHPEDYYQNLMLLSQNLREEKSLLFLQQIFNVLGNRDRFLILNSLKTQDRCSCEFEALLQKSQPAVSRDLRILENMKLIQGWKKGNFIHYSLVKSTFDRFFLILEKWSSSLDNWFEELYASRPQ